MRVLFAWEVGRNFGHVTKLVEVARPLAKRKAELFFALQNPAVIKPFSEGLKYKVLQAPYYPVQPPAPGSKRGPSLIYPDDLRPCGYDRPAELAGLIEAWRGLYELVKPDVLVVQAAPTALLAARGFKFKKAAFGAGYDVPPLATPMPPLRYWEKIDEEVMARHEEMVLNNVNEALVLAGIPKIKKFADALKVDAEFLTTFEELDHYPDRASFTKSKPKYCGPFYSIDGGEEVDWKKESGKRIFGYIRPETMPFKPCIEALRGLPDDYDVIIAAPGIPPGLKKQIEKPGLRIFNGAIRLDKLIGKCDLGICHGSSGISAAFALNGVPQLLLPGHIEQLMCSRAIGRNKAGRGLIGEYDAGKVTELISLLLNEGEFKQAAQNMAEKYKDFDPSKLATKIADELVKLAGGK